MVMHPGRNCGALLSQQRSVSALAQWAKQHATLRGAAFHPARGRVLREATLRRAWRKVDVQVLEQHRAPALASRHRPPKQWYQRVCRERHWTIENRVQYVRAVTFGEDAHQLHTGPGPRSWSPCAMRCSIACAQRAGPIWRRRCATAIGP